MRILVTSTLYPPVAAGGYERECARVVERLRERHDVLVLTSDAGEAPSAAGVRRDLPALSDDARGALRAPAASAVAVRAARAALDWRPDLVYAWNGSGIPHAALRVLADSGRPMAFRVCEHWFGRLFTGDQFLRELVPAPRSPARAGWSALCRAINHLPALRLDPTAPFPAAISWITERLRAQAGVPAAVRPVLEQVQHAVPPHGERYADVMRAPAPRPEIAFVGRVTPFKGLAVAIEALALLRGDHGVPARLIVVGAEEGEHGAELRRLAQDRGVAADVDWRGPLEADAIAAVLARAHAVVVPSDWEEPLGLVPIEAAFARVPVVAADAGGLIEALRPDEHALFFTRGDASGAAAALARTLGDPEATAARVARARRRAEDYRLGPYLDEQERFVAAAHEALQPPRRAEPGARTGRQLGTGCP